MQFTVLYYELKEVTSDSFSGWHVQMFCFCCAWFVCFRHIRHHEETLAIGTAALQIEWGSDHVTPATSLPLTSSGARSYLWPDLSLLKHKKEVCKVQCVVAYLTCSHNELTWAGQHQGGTSYDLLCLQLEKYEGNQQWLFRQVCIR